MLAYVLAHRVRFDRVGGSWRTTFAHVGCQVAQRKGWFGQLKEAQGELLFAVRQIVCVVQFIYKPIAHGILHLAERSQR